MQLKNALWHLGIYSSGLCITLSLSLMTWVATHSPFSADPVCCKVLAMSRANSHSPLFIFRDNKFTCSVKNQIGFGDLWTRRATLASQAKTERCDSTSRVHDNKGQILKPTPLAPQGESTDQKEHFSSMAEPNATYYITEELILSLM